MRAAQSTPRPARHIASAEGGLISRPWTYRAAGISRPWTYRFPMRAAQFTARSANSCGLARNSRRHRRQFIRSSPHAPQGISRPWTYRAAGISHPQDISRAKHISRPLRRLSPSDYADKSAKYFSSRLTNREENVIIVTVAQDGAPKFGDFPSMQTGRVLL